MRRNHRLVPVLLLVILAAACQRPPERTGQAAAVLAPRAATPAAPAAGAYDRTKDPLVNPKSLFEPPPADESLIADDETLYRNIDGNPSSLNPMFKSSTYEFWLAQMMFDLPFTNDADMNWMVNPNVVEDFQESADHLVYTVKLKAGLKWQDGAPFTADDICFSFHEIMDERVPVAAMRSGTDQIKKCEVVDPRTVRFTHSAALATNKWNVSFDLVPKHLYEKDLAAHPDINSGDYYNKLNRAPVGNGPYKFAQWIENDKIVLERWEDYPGRKPHFKRMIFRIIPEPNIALLTFTKGDLDEFRMTAQQFATQAGPGSDFERAGGYKVHATQWQFYYIGWNQDGSNPFFNDLRVRKAMTMACNLARMRHDLTYDLYEQAHGIFHPDSWMADPSIQLLPFDLDKAAALLDEAGWKADDSKGGWRYKTIDGQPVKFEFTLLIPEGSSLGPRVAAIFQQDLKSIGVDMKQQTLEWATFEERTRKHEFQASTAAWGTGTDPDGEWNIWRSDQYDKQGRFGRNYGGYSNPRVDELLVQGRHEFDQAKRKAIYQEIDRLIYEDQPYTFTFNPPTLWAVHRRLHGLRPAPQGLYLFEPAEKAWWVRAGEQRQASAGP